MESNQAKDKAEELIKKFTMSQLYNVGMIYDGKITSQRIARHCALLCVEEIQQSIELDWMEVQNLDTKRVYWELIRHELIKM